VHDEKLIKNGKCQTKSAAVKVRGLLLLPE